MSNPLRSGLPLLLTLTAFLLPAPRQAAAQSGYKFHPPAVQLSLRGGMGGPVARGEIYDLFTSELTIKRGDFRTFATAGDLSVRVAPRWDVNVGFGYDHSSTRSEFNDWVDTDNQPIVQTTDLRRAPLTVNAKYYPLPRGRSVSRYAWVPYRFTPYVTAGGGVMFYKLVQNGDWVNYQTQDIFSHRFTSSGVGGVLNAGAGADWWLTTNLALTADARYAWSSAGLEQDFDFDRINLSGFQVTTGLAVRF